MERRKYPRIAYGAWVEDLTKEGRIQFFLAKDLSLGGLLLVADEPPAVGNRVHLRLVVENEARVMAMDGEVIRHTPVDSGQTAFAVRFINLDLARQAFLEELLNECGEQPEPEPLQPQKTPPTLAMTPSAAQTTPPAPLPAAATSMLSPEPALESSNPFPPDDDEII
jgi:hypothetical protein